eukprot:189815_1
MRTRGLPVTCVGFVVALRPWVGIGTEAWLQKSFVYGINGRGVRYITPCRRVITSAGAMPTMKEEVASSSPSLLPINNRDDEVLLQHLKAGQALSACVKHVTRYAAFVDCGIKRKGKGGHLVSVTGFLHISDVPEGTAFFHRGSHYDRGANMETYIKEGTYIRVHVKDLFKQQGRLTVTLYPDIDRKCVSKERRERRYVSTIFRRKLRSSTNKSLPDFPIGSLVNGVVMRKSEKGVLVDVGAPRYAKLPMGAISKFMGGKYVEIKDLPRPGTRVLCSVTDSWLDETETLSVRLGLVEVGEFPTRRSACGEVLVDRQQQCHTTTNNHNCKNQIEAGSNEQMIAEKENDWRENNKKIPDVDVKGLEEDLNNNKVVINKRKNYPRHSNGDNEIVTIDCTGLGNSQEGEEFDETFLIKSLKKNKMKIVT